MKTIVIKTQKEWDEMLITIQDESSIEIRSSETISVYSNPLSSKVRAYGSSKVVAYDSSKVWAYDSSEVVAHGSSEVWAYGSSVVVAYDSSKVVAYGSSEVRAYGSSEVWAHDSSEVLAYGSSKVEANGSSKVWAHGSSEVLAYGSSEVLAYGSSEVRAYLASTLRIFSSLSTVKAYDNVHIFENVETYNLDHCDRSVTFRKYKDTITPTFEQWVERGIVFADGIYQKLIGQEIQGDMTIYQTDKGYVAKKGEEYAHGDTKSEAIQDLIFKTSERCTSQFENWKIEDIKTKEELIFAYRCITGACKQGVRDFVNSKQISEKMKISDVINITKGHYGHKVFKEFFAHNNL